MKPNYQTVTRVESDDLETAIPSVKVGTYRTGGYECFMPFRRHSRSATGT